MKLIRGLYNLRAEHKHCVATIGNFDGIHLGHQKIINRLLEKSKALDLPTCIINFEPYPQEYFLQDQAPTRLSRSLDKIQHYQQQKIDQLLLLKFNQHLKNLTGEQFIEQVLVKGLAIKHLIIGDDFLFGKNRSGNFELLQKLGKKYGFTVANTPTLSYNKERISSTRIRNCLQKGNMDQAQQLLGRPYSICARVTHGAKMGRTIGFPTANLPTHRKKTPVLGVFAVQTHVDGKLIYGVANVGKRPTVDGVNILLEVHLFNFKGDLYGTKLHVELLHKIRDEQKFDSFNLLKQQILKDADVARDYFNKNN